MKSIVYIRRHQRVSAAQVELLMEVVRSEPVQGELSVLSTSQVLATFQTHPLRDAENDAERVVSEPKTNVLSQPHNNATFVFLHHLRVKREATTAGGC